MPKLKPKQSQEGCCFGHQPVATNPLVILLLQAEPRSSASDAANRATELPSTWLPHPSQKQPWPQYLSKKSHCRRAGKNQVWRTRPSRSPPPKVNERELQLRHQQPTSYDSKDESKDDLMVNEAICPFAIPTKIMMPNSGVQRELAALINSGCIQCLISLLTVLKLGINTRRFKHVDRKFSHNVPY